MSKVRLNVITCMKILAPGKGSQISHLIAELLPMPHFPKAVSHSLCIQVLNSTKVCLKTS